VHEPSRMAAALLAAIAATLALAVLPGPAAVAQKAAPELTAATPTPQGPDAERRFWVHDNHPYTSPWYRGGHRRMINFGCTRAPYYPDSPRCSHHRGFHHGIDIAMRCGNPLFAGARGRVVDPGSAGALGPAYGAHAFRIRNAAHDIDIVIGHTRRVFVDPGDRVHRGQRIARASDAAAPDGCHLHFEVRPAGACYLSARNPERWFRLHRQPIPSRVD
jgi:murein DD-endopeptidase MepM/ murein hydrolase activator NlpD